MKTEASAFLGLFCHFNRAEGDSSVGRRLEGQRVRLAKKYIKKPEETPSFHVQGFTVYVGNHTRTVLENAPEIRSLTDRTPCRNEAHLHLRPKAPS